MTEFCSCGAQLPPDARFCHKCGKPQVELIEPEVPEPVAPAVLPVSAAPVAPSVAGIGLRNPMAVRAGLLAGTITSLVMILPLPAVLQLLWQIVMLLAGGFLAVYIYVRRSGGALSLRGGALLGWLAGLFCFLIMLVLFTISVAAIATGEGLQQSFHEMIAARGNAEVAQQFDELLRSPVGIGALLFGMLLTSFLMITVLPTIGGALAAKVLEKE